MERISGFISTALVALMLSAAAAAQQPDAVSRAMKDELARSIDKLRLPKLDKPYFIAYRVDEVNSTTVSATLGALTASTNARSRSLAIEMHVGDYALDNTNFLAMQSFGFGMSGEGRALPLDDDYDQIRRAIWLATDGAYKTATKELSAKRSVLEHQQNASALPDFTPQPPVKVEEPPANLKIDVQALEKLARQLSAVFRDSPDVFASGVEIVVRDQYTRYLNTEGTWFTRAQPLVMMNISAEVRAQDGLPLQDSLQVYARTKDALEDPALVARTRNLLDHLEALRKAPTLDSYNGPVLFEDNAAGEALAQVLAPALTASRFPVTDQPQFEAQFQQVMAQFGGNSLADRIGGRILPAGFDLADEPRSTTLRGASLLGACQVDDDGVPTREAKLIDHGILRSVLATRVPTLQTKVSTGSRRALGPSPSNLVLTARETMSAPGLKTELLRRAKERGLEYGILIRRVGPAGLSWVMRMAGFQRGAGLAPAPAASDMYRVYSDGREELVRGGEIEPMTAAAFKDIVAAGDRPIVYNGVHIPLASSIFAVLGGAGLSDGMPAIVSYVTPSLLFDDVSLKKSNAPAPNGPIAPSPVAGRVKK